MNKSNIHAYLYIDTDNDIIHFHDLQKGTKNDKKIKIWGEN